MNNGRYARILFARAFVVTLFASFAPSLVAQNPPAARALGAIKSIAANSLVLASDTGAEVLVNLHPAARILRIAPGEKDLKNADPVSFADLQQGDRILVRGSSGDAGKTIFAASVIVMKQADIARKRAREREEWQKHGIGGLVKTVDPAAATIEITTNASSPANVLLIRIAPKTILRRYAPDSVKFDDARPAPLDQIRSGDQLRARGSRGAGGAELSADEIVSGSFRNVAGTVVSANSASGILTVRDLTAREEIAVHITPQTQMRKLPLPLAQRIAFRLRGEAPPQGTPPNAAPAAPAASGANPARGANGDTRAPGAGDFQQLISRLPAASLSDLQKGDAVMIVATQPGRDGRLNAITLLGGVEPILQASPKGAQDMILSPWSLGGGGAEAGAGVESP